MHKELAETKEMSYSLMVGKLKREKMLKARNAIRRERKTHERKVRDTWAADGKRSRFEKGDMDEMDCEEAVAETSKIAGSSNSE